MKYRYGEHYIDEADIKAVNEVLKSDFLTCGPKVEEFENVVSKKFNYKNALAVNSGTAALHLVLESLNLKSGDEVIVPAITFVATANVVLMCGAKVVFADVNPNTLLISGNDVQEKITENTKAVIAVDMAGQLCDYNYLQRICFNQDLTLISDACHSTGIQHNLEEREKPDFICYSFHPVKHMTTGEGGMVLTDSFNEFCLMQKMRSHGMNAEKNMLFMGYNYRMPDINAALGISQLKKLPNFLHKRKYLADLYYENLKDYCLEVSGIHSYHLFIIKANNRDELRYKLFQEKGISTQIHYKPVYDNDYYKLNGYENAYRNCPNTESIKDKILSIPIYYSMKKNDVEYISKSILEVIE